MPSYSPNTLATAHTFIRRRLGDECQVTVSRRSRRWLAAVEWTREFDGSRHMAGTFGPPDDPSADRAIWALMDRVQALADRNLV